MASAATISGGGAAAVANKTKGVVARVVAEMREEIEAGDLPPDTVGTVVAIMREVFAVTDAAKRHELSSAALERTITRCVELVIPNSDHPVRRHLGNIVWALKMAAATDKEHFGGALMVWAAEQPVDVLLAAMQRVQRTANAARGKLSATVLQSNFAHELAASGVADAVVNEASMLVSAGLVTEVVSLLKDDGELSDKMKTKLKVAGLRVALQVVTATAERCASGKCRLFACCSGGGGATTT
jgi:ATP/maltotriose-dependent transcriptional regulator MalT